MRLPEQRFRWVLTAVVALGSLHLVLALLGLQGPIAPLVLPVVFFGSGLALWSAVRTFSHEPDAPVLSLPVIVGSTFLSFSVLALASSLLSVSWLLRSANLAIVLDGVSVLAGAVGIIRGRHLPTRSRPPPDRAGLRGGLFVCLGASLLFIVWRQTPVFPVVNGWDMNTFLVPIEFMRSRGGFEYYLVPPFPSSAEIPYPGAIFHLIAGLSLYLGVDPRAIFWWAPWPILVAYAGLLYAMVLRYSRMASLAVPAAFLAVFLVAPTAEVVRSPLYLTPDMVSQVLILLALTWYAFTASPPRTRGIVAFFTAMFLGAFYFYALLPVFPFFLAMLLGSRRIPVLGSTFRLFVAAYVLLLAALGALGLQRAAPDEGLGQFIQPEVFPLGLKAVVLFALYSPPMWIPLAFTLVAYLPRAKHIGARPLSLHYFGVASLALLGAYWLPVWATYRFEFYMRTFLVVLFAAVAFELPGPTALPLPRPLFPRLRRVATRILPSPRTRMVVAVTAVFILPAAVLSPGFLDASRSYLAYYSLDEHAMGEWIQYNLPADVYLATDPGSGYFFRGLAFRNASHYFILADGRAPWNGSSIYPGINELLFNAFRAPTPNIARAMLADLGFSSLYVLVTTRTPAWFEHGPDVQLSHPDPSADSWSIAERFSAPFFNPVHRAGEVYLFAMS